MITLPPVVTVRTAELLPLVRRARTTAEKHEDIAKLLTDPANAHKSDRAIGRMAGTTKHAVYTVRHKLSPFGILPPAADARNRPYKPNAIIRGVSKFRQARRREATTPVANSFADRIERAELLVERYRTACRSPIEKARTREVIKTAVLSPQYRDWPPVTLAKELKTSRERIAYWQTKLLGHIPEARPSQPVFDSFGE